MAVNQFNKRKTELLCQDSTGVNNSGLGIPPIGIGTSDKTGNAYVVFRANTRYFEAIKLIQNNHITSNDKKMSSTL